MRSEAGGGSSPGRLCRAPCDERTVSGDRASLRASCSCRQLPAGGHRSRSALVSGFRSRQPQGKPGKPVTGVGPAEPLEALQEVRGAPGHWAFQIEETKRKEAVHAFPSSSPARPWRASHGFSAFSLASRHLRAASPDPRALPEVVAAGSSPPRSCPSPCLWPATRTIMINTRASQSELAHDLKASRPVI